MDPARDPWVEELACPGCGLTSAGAELLRRELGHLRRTSPAGSWVVDLCERCGRVTAIHDRKEGWTLGRPSAGRLWAVDPGHRAAPEGTPAPPRDASASVPRVDPSPARRPPRSMGDAWAFGRPSVARSLRSGRRRAALPGA